MLPTLIELVVAPALAAAATLTARRWGPRAGGVVSAFPAIVGPVLLITALEHGASFSARAANGTLLGLASLSAFALAYGRTAISRGSLVSLAVGWLCAGATAVAIGAVAGRVGPPAGLLVALGSLALAHRALRPASHVVAPSHDPPHPEGLAQQAPPRHAEPLAHQAPPRHAEPLAHQAPLQRAAVPVEPARPPDAGARAEAARLRHDLPLRMALTALLVFSLATAAALLGPLVGGMLAALPVLASTLAVFTHHQRGALAAAALLRGTLTGMAGFVAFVQVVASLIVSDGIATAFLAATFVALIVQAAAVTPRASAWVGRRHRAQPTPAVVSAGSTR